MTAGESPVSARQNGNAPDHPKLDEELDEATLENGESEVIVEFTDETNALNILAQYGHDGHRLGRFSGYTARIPNDLLDDLANQGAVWLVHSDRPAISLNGRTAAASGARTVQQLMHYTGAGVGVAVIDSGVVADHLDLSYEVVTSSSNALPAPPSNTVVVPTNSTSVVPTNSTSPVSTVTTYSGQRVAHFADFINRRTTPYDDNGHGSHVAATIAGNGAASAGDRKAMAPGASIIAIKALDREGRGNVSDIIAAIDYVVSIKDQYNIRVLNLSVGAGVYESYLTDPLTRAAKRAVDAGIIVVAAAGNLGRAADGRRQFGGITAPANAPWVLTVGASSTEGTIDRADDIVPLYSSNGPTMYDYRAKPDLVGPGTGTVSASSVGSHLYELLPHLRLPGVGVSGFPYMSLTGTSMAAPAVSGTVALMLEANPNLTPNLAKAILQYTAEVYSGYDWLTQGAGFLNARAAVELAEFFRRGRPGDPYPDMTGWSGHLFWGNFRVSGGIITPGGTAWGRDVNWGASRTPNGQPIVWGENCPASTTGAQLRSCGGLSWGSHAVWGRPSTDNASWSPTDNDNFVWGDPAVTNIVWGNGHQDNIVWGNNDGDNIVWGNECLGQDCQGIVWGHGSGQNIVWGNSGGQNIVWGNCQGSGCDNIVWGNTGTGGSNIVWGNGGVDDVVFTSETGEVRSFDPRVWDDLFKSSFNSRVNSTQGTSSTPR